MQEIVPFVLQVNANAFLANVDRADFLTMIVLTKLENVFVINRSDVLAFTRVYETKPHDIRTLYV